MSSLIQDFVDKELLRLSFDFVLIMLIVIFLFLINIYHLVLKNYRLDIHIWYVYIKIYSCRMAVIRLKSSETLSKGDKGEIDERKSFVINFNANITVINDITTRYSRYC